MLMNVQQHLLDMLKEIDSLCKENNITYYLGGGCLVGAIRNGGFLPWDDDVDIHMTRENAMRFMALRESFPKNRELLCYELDHKAPTVLWRYVDTSRTTYMRSTFYFDAPGGQFVDIFVLDPVKADEEEIEKLERRRQLFYEFCMTQYFIDTRYDEDFIHEYMSLKKREKRDGFEAIHREFEDELYSGSEDGATYYLVRTPSTDVRPFPKRLWGTPRFVKFENTMMPVPEKAEELLLFAYGDRWVDIPSQVDRGFHVFLSDDILPYKIYKKEIDKYIDKDEMYRFHEKRKNMITPFLLDRNEINSRQWLLFTGVVKKKIHNLLEDEKLNLKELIRGKNIKTLEKVFEDYYFTQFTRYKFYNLYFDMSDEWIYAAMFPLLYKGKYHLIAKVLKLREEDNEKIMSKELLELKELINDLANITNYIYVYNREYSARNLIDKNLRKWSWQITLLRSDIRLMFYERKSKKIIKEKVTEYLREYPADGELLKYYADTLMAEKNYNKAKTIYKKAYGTIVNGLIKSEIVSIMEELDSEN